MLSKLKKFVFVSVLCACSALFGDSCSYEEILAFCQTEQVEAVHEVFDKLCQNDLDKKKLIFNQMEGGLTRARLYSFNFNNQKYVLRFLDPKHPDIQRHNEIKACKIAHSLSLGPDCIFSDQHSLLMIMPFIEGRALASRDLEDSSLICRLGQMLSTLHSYVEEYPMRYSLAERLLIHYRKGQNSGIAYPTGFDQSINTALKKSSHLSTTPCHGDLNLSNILVRDKEIFIIDWANATYDDPFVDLGFVSLLTNMTDEQNKLFLKTYLGREATAAEYSKLRTEKSKICLLTAAIWLRYSEDAQDQQVPYHERVAKLDTQLNDPSLKSVQEYLKEGIVVNLRSDSKEAIKAYALSFYKAYLSISEL